MMITKSVACSPIGMMILGMMMTILLMTLMRKNPGCCGSWWVIREDYQKYSTETEEICKTSRVGATGRETKAGVRAKLRNKS